VRFSLLALAAKGEQLVFVASSSYFSMFFAAWLLPCAPILFGVLAFATCDVF
jgi:hypothetical protein